MVQIVVVVVYQLCDQGIFWWLGVGYGVVQCIGVIVQIDRFVVVFFDQVLYIGCDDVVGFFLVNVFEFVFIVCFDLFYWIFQVVWIVDMVMYGMFMQVGVNLVQVVVIVIVGIVCFDIFDFIVYDVYMQWVVIIIVNCIGVLDNFFV